MPTSFIHYRLVPTLALLIVLPACLGLGYWQLERAREKESLQSLYDARGRDVVLQIGAERVDPQAVRFYRVTARGEYDPARQILVDNRVHQGVAGYHVVTPLRIRGAETRVLVNRGWIRLGTTRANLPAIETPVGEQLVEGVAVVPHDDPFMLREPGPIGERWETVWQHLDLKRFQEAMSYPVQPVVVLLDPKSAAGGFTREWHRLDTGIAVHRAYAFQWFTLAAAALSVYVFYGLRAAKARAARTGDE